MFCVNNILLAKPSVSYFCPANLHSLIGTAVLDNQIGHFIIFPGLYFSHTHLCCLAHCLFSKKILQQPNRRKRYSAFSRNVFHLVAPLAAVDLNKAPLRQFCVFVQAVVVTGPKPNCLFLHVDIGACLHNVRLTSTQNVFCSSLVNTFTLLQHV